MGSWNRLTCMHGVREELDYHACPKCKKIAEAMGKEWIDGEQTYIYRRLPRALAGCKDLG